MLKPNYLWVFRKLFSLLVVSILLTGLILGVSAPIAVQAGGTVSTCDEPSLLAALSGGGNVTFACDGTITLTNTVTISSNTTLDGIGHNVTISGGNSIQIFLVNPGITFSVQGLTLANSKNGPAILNDTGVLSINAVTFSNNNNSNFGGAIYNIGIATVIGSTFINNRGFGGGIYNDSNSILTITGSTFTGNTSTLGYGGAIYNKGAAILANSSFSNNSGPALYNFFDNSIPDNKIATLNLINSMVNNNTGGAGGGLINDLGDMHIDNSVISNNNAGSGGGIYNLGGPGTLTINNSTISGNVSNNGTGGGGIYNSGPAYIYNSTISDNAVNSNLGIGGGGGIYNISLLSVINSTIANNTVIADNIKTGSGIYNYSPNGGDPYTTVTLKNTIVSNSATGGNCNGTYIIDGGSNLQFPGTTCGATIPSADPKLGLLADNGGVTQTHALLAGSPAIDAGNNAVCASSPVSNRDQRGALRPFDGDSNGSAICDIGAYELGATAPSTVPVITSISPASVTAGGSAFTLTVNGSNFSIASVVRWNNSDRPTTFINSSQLIAQISASDIAAVGTPSITVFTPPLGGGTSNSQTLTISATCQDLVVTSTGNNVNTCGTLPHAVASVTANNKVISFALSVIPNPVTINLTGSLSVPADVTINGICTPSGPGIILKGPGSGDGLILGSNGIISGLKIFGFNRQIVATGVSGNHLTCVAVSKT